LVFVLRCWFFLLRTPRRGVAEASRTLKFYPHTRGHFSYAHRGEASRRRRGHLNFTPTRAAMRVAQTTPQVGVSEVLLAQGVQVGVW